MTFPRPVAVPGGRVLAGWWKQLAAWRPQSVWVGSIYLERIEALCSIQQNDPLAPLDRILLDNLDAETPSSLAVLDTRLGLGPNLLNRILSRLEHSKVARNTAAGWILSAAGIAAGQTGVLPGTRTERRVFWFLSHPEEPGAQTFVVPANPGVFQSIENCPINRHSLETLIRTVRQDASRKRRQGFPEDVESILTPEGQASRAIDWVKIVVVYPFSLQAVLVSYKLASGEPGLAVFPYQEHGWSLAARPVIELAAGWDEVFPRLPLEPSVALVSEAWRRWLGQRGMAQAADQYRLELHGETISVSPSVDGLDILGGPRGDLARGEAWLVLREGALRQVIRLEPDTAARPAS